MDNKTTKILLLFAIATFKITKSSSESTQCQTGQHQSPIIYDQAQQIIKYTTIPLIMINGYNALPSEIKFFNTGKGVKVSMIYNNNAIPQITGGPLNDDVYNFAQFHYHYPCEHLPQKYVDQCHFEIHFVHFNSKYKTIDDAANKSDGLAVIAVMYEATLSKEPKRLPFLPMVKNVPKEGDSYTEQKNLFSYSDAIGFYQISNYISYRGSLTTPPCMESVIWIVIDKLFPMSPNDLETFQKIFDKNGIKLQSNNRRIQPLNGRIVMKYE